MLESTPIRATVPQASATGRPTSAPLTGPRKLAYSMASAAVATDLSEKTVQRAIRSGALRAKKIGRGVRILHPDLVEWLKELPDA